MNKNMLDILACPIDKNHPLELFEISAQDSIISEGALYCKKCTRFYPIIEEIPIMLPDDLREKKLEMEFLKRNEKSLPEKIVNVAKPWHL
ncbi:MAG: Trm112 family protein [Thaumarchaeota archaeon]|nr:Trm112 family protein [Nitrososphaerota archaeon]